MNVDKDAFSSGQIGSKIWLCEELERTGWQSEKTYIYGGWYGITAFLLLSRGKFDVKKIVSIDLDEQCEPVADMLNEYWVWQEWKFKAITGDVGLIIPTGDLVINTSTEHFDDMNWFHNIPKGTRVAFQGNNMPHYDHVVHSESLEDFISQYPLSDIIYTGSKEFVYPDWNFTRYMIVGTK
jgi:hypothetical protein